jgi:hypothetical protein
MLFEVNGLCKRFGRIVTLPDVSFQVRAGEKSSAQHTDCAAQGAMPSGT